VASPYADWWATLEEYFVAFSADEKRKIFGANTAAFYHFPATSSL
jgi:predicted TIM-barrel fold metal-dependent hydrolase